MASITDILESANIPPADFTNLTAEWNGKGVQVLRTEHGAWLTRKIPVDSQGIKYNLSERVTSVNSIPKLSQNLALDKASASDLQQAQPLRKQAMFKNMADGRSCEYEDAGAVQSQVLRQFRDKALPTVEEVLEQHNLKFAPSIFGQRDFVILETSKYTWILMPIQPAEADSLQGKITVVDALDHEVIRKLLENNSLLFSSTAETDPYFAMTQWV